MLGTPSLEIGKDHLVAADLVVEGPVLGTPALQQIHALVAEFSASAVLDAPAFTANSRAYHRWAVCFKPCSWYANAL